MYGEEIAAVFLVRLGQSNCRNFESFLDVIPFRYIWLEHPQATSVTTTFWQSHKIHSFVFLIYSCK